MNGSEILEVIKSLGQSQGFYHRLYEMCIINPFIVEDLEKKEFKNIIDLILYLEDELF